MESAKLGEYFLGRNVGAGVVERLLDHPDELGVERLGGRLRFVVSLVRASGHFPRLLWVGKKVGLQVMRHNRQAEEIRSSFIPGPPQAPRFALYSAIRASTRAKASAAGLGGRGLASALRIRSAVAGSIDAASASRADSGLSSGSSEILGGRRSIFVSDQRQINPARAERQGELEPYPNLVFGFVLQPCLVKLVQVTANLFGRKFTGTASRNLLRGAPPGGRATVRLNPAVKVIDIRLATTLEDS
jgi:hypothetical protein